MSDRKPGTVPNVELIERKLACENGRFYVYLDHVRARDGYEVPDYLVVAPKTDAADMASGVGVLPCRDGNIGLLRLYRHPVSTVVWEMPRGFLEPGELTSVSALRELEEETGLRCPPKRLLDLGTILPEAGILRARVHIFAALDCEPAREFPREEIGHHEFRWFSRDEVESMVRNGAIEDATTLAAICRFLLIAGTQMKKS